MIGTKEQQLELDFGESKPYFSSKLFLNMDYWKEGEEEIITHLLKLCNLIPDDRFYMLHSIYDILDYLIMPEKEEELLQWKDDLLSQLT